LTLLKAKLFAALRAPLSVRGNVRDFGAARLNINFSWYDDLAASASARLMADTRRASLQFLP
jgi:hypothetical protein